MGHEHRTHTNPFTDEQVSLLKENRHVKSVSKSTIRFTEEFKRYFYNRRRLDTPSRQIFLECGIDPEILGRERIEGFCHMINTQAKRENGFSDKRQDNYRHPSSDPDGTMESRLRKLEHELAYTRQEVEFLKKLQMADMEARRQWESKHQPK